MKAISLSIVILFITLHYSRAQNQVNYWMGGSHAMIKFDGNGVHSQYRPDNDFFLRTTASISDSIGNLLFYTNGFRVLNQSFKVMQNGDSLNIGDYISQGNYALPVGDGAALLPLPGKGNLYYLFHVDLNNITDPKYIGFWATHIFYSIIDMSLDKGKGGIVVGKKDISILNDTLADGIKVVKHANGRDWWLICHGLGNNKYYKFLVDPYGIHGPYIQDIGIVYIGENASVSSPMKFYLSGETFIHSSYDSNIVELYNFDRCSGEFYNYRKFMVNDSNVYLQGASFSPSGKYLYISSNSSDVLQFDLTNPDIHSTRTLVGKDDGVFDPYPAQFYYQEIGSNGKIYVVDYDGYYSISVINNPDSTGLTCNFVQRGFQIDTPGEWGASIPNIPNYSLGPLAGSACDSLKPIDYPNPNFTWSVYPNPFAKQLNFSVTGATTDAEILVFNLIGQQLFYTLQEQANNFVNSKIDLSPLPVGMYIVTIKVNGKQYERKVVKM